MVAQETLDSIEKTLDVIEDNLETIERIPKVHLNGTTKKQQIIILGVTAGVSFVAGGGLSFLVLKNRLKMKYEQIAEAEIEEARTHYQRLNKTGEFATPTDALRTLTGDAPEDDAPASIDEVIKELEYVSGDDRSSRVDDLEDEVVETVHNVFQNARGDGNFVWNQSVEESKRSHDYPYVITAEEFNEHEDEDGNEFDEIQLTYYDGGNVAVLADQRDGLIDDVDGLVGEANLQRFGHGSGDRNIVFVRNEMKRCDYEIAISTMSYARDVLGMDEDEEASPPHGRYSDG